MQVTSNTHQIAGLNIFILSSSSWSSISYASLQTQRFGRKRSRHGLAIVLHSVPEETKSGQHDKRMSLLLSKRYGTLRDVKVSLTVAVAAAAAILQHGDAVHVVVDDPTSVESYSFVFELLHATGACGSTEDSSVLQWIQSHYSYSSLPVPEALENLDDVPLSWSQILFPLGPEIHEMLRTTNGINFGKATQERITVNLPSLPPLNITQSNADSFDGLGAVVWQCGEVLCNFFDMSDKGKELIRDKNVYDLGCGTGLVGIVISLCGAKRVVLSDRKPIVELAKENVRCNLEQCAAARVEYENYEWKEEGTATVRMLEKQEQQQLEQQLEKHLHHDVVIVSDGLYDHHSYPGLLSTIQRLLSLNSATRFLFGYKMRHPLRENIFFQRLEVDAGMTLNVYDQLCVYPNQLRGTGIFIVEAAI